MFPRPPGPPRSWGAAPRTRADGPPLTQGLGKAKAYGCGLMTLAKAG
ncbi:type I-E CRISPR-associated protein Cas6/Cse3/CasE [Streptomyces erythrochromogenes]